MTTGTTTPGAADATPPAGDQKTTEGAAPVVTSILPEDGGGAAPDAAAVAAAAAAAAAAKTKTGDVLSTNQGEAEWFLSEGVKGTGKAPEWYKADKYKNLAEQAKAYVEIEKRLGGFVGAPADGKYEFKLPEGVTGEFDQDHALMKEFNKTAAELQMSPEAYNRVLGMFARYEAGLAPDPAANLAEAKTILGEKADERIASIAAWGKANLGSEGYKELRAALNAEVLPGAAIAAVLKTVEAIIGKTRQVAMPKQDDDTAAAVVGSEAEINALQAKKGPDGKRLYETDPAYRAMVEQKRNDLYKKNQAA
jgi:hypothetical protein